MTAYQLFPNLTLDEMEALTADVKARGVMVPVEKDEAGNILDGHHRVMIADSLGIDYPVVVREGWSEDQKLTHVVSLNAHRRHLTPTERAEVVGRLMANGLSKRAIAKTLKVDDKTVRNDLAGADFSAPQPERVTGSDGKSYPFKPRLPHSYFDAPAVADAALPVESVPVLPTDKWDPGAGLMSSDTPEWYTPKRVVKAVVRALGVIDLDPCAEPAKSVPAVEHYTEEDDGLSRPWAGRVYMNPPYGRSIVAWVEKLQKDFDAGLVHSAVALLPARTETDWWEALRAEHICLIHGRLAFSDHATSAPFPSAALYLGPDGDSFRSAFAPLGRVYRWEKT